MAHTDSLYRQLNWPLSAVEQRVFPISSNPLFAAAQALALVAYPKVQDRKPGGLANKYCEALLADMFRLAKSWGKQDLLPEWVGKIKTTVMRKRIEAGDRRLLLSIAALQTIFEAEMVASDNEAARSGEARTFTLGWSADFHKMEIQIPFQRTSQGDQLVGKVPEERSAALRAAIIRHRVAFGKGAGDEQDAYVNIYNRLVSPIFPMFSLMMAVHQAAISKGQDAHTRKLPISEILMRQPDWAKNLHSEVRRLQGQAIFHLRHIGIPICACRMIHLDVQE